ncbi:formate--tetrahydrofolate ligase [Chondromyces apiculatus]|uniref:Formate--tetrahydrofolate ligase n=1 Tax=Chondromyces apiculatus DSM 436 TaxID=1192034 RepID=A0A017STV9_9BACT|nr:formate--tetrahydrofolate ligase [Chondromyces apiculatus]EYF00404.1 Formate--tetrahydrofolate ligase [Chondromyces apiculatus DSM 436]
MSSSNRTFSPQRIQDVASELGIAEEHLEIYGRGKAKVDLAALTDAPRGAGRVVLVSAINPTPAGEGKTTTSVGLAMGLRRLDKRVALCLREPSLGPVFGVKGGGTGGGRATLVPSDDINLHFTGDLHAITTAHNLLSAMIDNACHFGVHCGPKDPLDPRRITWGRALDMNDRALRNVVLGLGRKTDGVPRQDRFDITAASEVMAIVALASSYEDLEQRLGRIVVGTSLGGAPVTAADVGAASAMTALLRDALKPNLVQTAEGGPALVHAGPFANIAHGCSSILATRLGITHADFVVTEGGFGFDLGGEKFLDIKCRAAGIWPRVLVLVATLRALKMHGGAPVKRAAEPDAEALRRGFDHLAKHLETAAFYGLPVVVAINVFPNDTAEELTLVEEALRERNVRMARCEGFARGGEGALDLAEAVAQAAEASDDAPPAPRFAYALSDPLEEKIRKIARVVYGADDVTLSAGAEKDRARLEALGGAELPVCMAKTQLSLTDDPAIHGRPRGFTVNVRELRLSAGAGFVVALTGEMMTMPGLPREPAALRVKLLPDGRIRGLMQNDD